MWAVQKHASHQRIILKIWSLEGTSWPTEKTWLGRSSSGPKSRKVKRLRVVSERLMGVEATPRLWDQTLLQTTQHSRLPQVRPLSFPDSLISEVGLGLVGMD